MIDQIYDRIRDVYVHKDAVFVPYAAAYDPYMVSVFNRLGGSILSSIWF